MAISQIEMPMPNSDVFAQLGFNGDANCVRIGINQVIERSIIRRTVERSIASCFQRAGNEHP